jgi:hypothetical protein
MLKKLILTAAAGTALLSSAAFADNGWHHGWEHRHHWHPYGGYVVVGPQYYPAPAPYYVAPAPVYVAPPAPVYSQPAPVYYPAPAYVAPAPAVTVGFRVRL